MNKVSFEEAGALLVTFYADEGVKQGQVVKVSRNGTVAPCGDGEPFCGLAGSCGGGTAGVQVQGFAQAAYSGEMSLGRMELVANGEGGVRAAAENEKGIPALVVDADPAGKTIMICL